MYNLFLVCQKGIPTDSVFAFYIFLIIIFVKKTSAPYNPVSKASIYCLDLHVHYLILEC